MIFVSVGTQKFQMDRLMKQVEKLAKEMPEERFVVQYGYSTYVPSNCEVHQFMDRDTFSQCIDESDVMILHGGVGTIMQGLKSHKRIIVVPRLKQFGEHVDDHQMEAAWALKSNHCVLICMNTVFLGFLIKHAKEYEFKDYEEPKHKVEELVLEELAKESAKTKQPWSLQKSLLRFFTLGPKSQTEEIN